ncbi:putative kinase inhibitor protein [mine drainage metagenome]|uniref:Putative kinase inhibitor protein n=1 Tax=mine drainage metagenome TaxID=410659 RepID=A0A1J5R8V9_9ZZZZ
MMLRTSCTLAAAATFVCVATTAAAASIATLRVRVDHFARGGEMPQRFAVCIPKPGVHMGFGRDINPAVSWSKGPSGTQSYSVLLEDTDSPAEHRDWMNQPGKTLDASIQRRVFFHWVLVDIPANVNSIPEGEVSRGLVAHGKPASYSAIGVSGVNNYTMAFSGKPAMAGTYYGYDGPCPPWNDEVVHHYHFIVYALSVRKLELPPGFDGPAAMQAMQGKILAEGQELGLYTTNPAKR